MSKNRLTALEIEKREFTRGFRGYNVAEVRAFLELVSTEIESLERDVRTLRERLTQVEADKRRMEEIEDRVKDTLLVAQSAADQSRDVARREAEAILREAETARTVIVADIERLRSEKAAMIASLRATTEAFLARLEASREAAVFVDAERRSNA